MSATFHIYWLPEAECRRAVAELRRSGTTVTGALLTPCQALKAREGTAIHVPPAIWHGMCKRQGSWYRSSARAGLHMLVAAAPLPGEFERFRDAALSVSGFRPDSLPSDAALRALAAAPEYRAGKPAEWEKVKWWDSWLFKAFFTLTGFWRRGDNLAQHWLGHRANHANFLTKRFTTEIDGEAIAYSVTENARVCSSCAEFFNVVAPEDRKLVRACPGSVSIGGAQRDVYYDVRPVRAAPVRPHSAARGGPAAPAARKAR